MGIADFVIYVGPLPTQISNKIGRRTNIIQYYVGDDILMFYIVSPKRIDPKLLTDIFDSYGNIF